MKTLETFNTTANLQAKSVISRGSEDLFCIVGCIDVDVLQRRNENKELRILRNTKKDRRKMKNFSTVQKKSIMLLANYVHFTSYTRFSWKWNKIKTVVLLYTELWVLFNTEWTVNSSGCRDMCELQVVAIRYLLRSHRVFIITRSTVTERLFCHTN